MNPQTLHDLLLEAKQDFESWHYVKNLLRYYCRNSTHELNHPSTVLYDLFQYMPSITAEMRSNVVNMASSFVTEREITQPTVMAQFTEELILASQLPPSTLEIPLRTVELTRVCEDLNRNLKEHEIILNTLRKLMEYPK